MKKKKRNSYWDEDDTNKLPKIGDEPVFTEDWEFKKKSDKKPIIKKK